MRTRRSRGIRSRRGAKFGASQVIDLRIYRTVFLAALLAVVVALFSVQAVPSPLAESATPSTFETGAVAEATRAIIEAAPDRTPGGPGDNAIGDFVEEQFRGLRSGNVSEQRFDAEIDGEQRELRNVILTLPGESGRGLLILAHRDGANEPAAASSAAATAVVLELAERLGASRHAQTIVLASTDGGTVGGLGTRELVRALPGIEDIDAALVISQPGAQKERPPFIIGSADDARSTSSQLLETTSAIFAEQAGRDPGLPGALGDLARLALPSGLGEQAVLIELGVPAVAISSAGEAPLLGRQDQLDDLSSASLARVGRTALSTALALDVATQPLDRGPAAYLRMGENLIPGWALAAIALTLLLPALLTAAEACARAARRSQRIGTAAGWALVGTLPFLVPLLVIYGLGALGVIPGPEFPFDPREFSLNLSEALALVGIFAVFGLVAAAVRPLRAPSRPAPPVLAAATGLLAGLAVLGIWLQNPYLGLLLVPTAHLWILGARERGPLPVVTTVVALIAAVIPLALAAAYVADQTAIGLKAPWRLVVVIVSGQIPVGITTLLCLLAGALLASVAISRLRPREEPAPAVTELRTRGPLTHAGPGSLGGTESALPER